MMLDITGSMAGQKISDLQASATDLINIVVWPTKASTPPRSHRPLYRRYSPAQLRAERGTWDLLANVEKISGTTYYLSDCVVERMGTQKYTDAAPATGQYVMGHYTTNFTGSGSNKKGVCVVPATVLPLTSTRPACSQQSQSDGRRRYGGSSRNSLGLVYAVAELVLAVAFKRALRLWHS